MKVIISRIHLRLVQADKTLMAALQQPDQFVDPLNVIADGRSGIALVLEPLQQIVQHRSEDRKSSNPKTSAWT
jgi:hypothetical protein